MANVLVTGGSGNGGAAVSRALLRDGHAVRIADVAPPPLDAGDLTAAEFVRCDTRSVGDVRDAVEDVDAVVHLAAWHSAHRPPVGNDTIFGVNVQGTYHVLEACRRAGIESVVFASSMAYGDDWLYGATKVLGEDLCRAFQRSTRASVVMLRYHEFIPKPYLDFGIDLLYNGVDRRDVVTATVASTNAVLNRRVDLFMSIVHTDHGMPAHVRENFAGEGPAWCDDQVPGAAALIDRYLTGRRRPLPAEANSTIYRLQSPSSVGGPASDFSTSCAISRHASHRASTSRTCRSLQICPRPGYRMAAPCSPCRRRAEISRARSRSTSRTFACSLMSPAGLGGATRWSWEGRRGFRGVAGCVLAPLGVPTPPRSRR